MLIILALFLAGGGILGSSIHAKLWQSLEAQIIRELQGRQENTLIYIRQLLMLQGANNDEEGYKQIAEDKKEINTDNQLLASLRGIEGGVTSAVTYMGTALSALSEVRSMWDGFRKIIEGTLADMKHAETAASAIVKEMFTEAARRQWEDAHEIALQLLNTKIKVEENGTIGDQVA